MDNNKKPKINIVFLVLSILTPILICGIAIGIITAWYTNVIQTGDINATTKNLAIEYEINNSEKNITTYNITNLAFFDADDDYEGQFLSEMAFEIELHMTNKSSDTVSYKVEFEANKIKYPAADSTTIAYPACIYNSVAKDTTNRKTVNSYLTNPAPNVTYTLDDTTKFVGKIESQQNLAVNGDVTIKLYIFGIQDLDGAKNDDFLYTDNTKVDTRTYQFKLSVIAEPQGSPNVTENPTTTTTVTNTTEG